MSIPVRESNARWVRFASKAIASSAPRFSALKGVPFDSNGDGCKDACTNPCEGVTCGLGEECFNGNCVSACDPFACLIGDPVDTDGDGMSGLLS